MQEELQVDGEGAGADHGEFAMRIDERGRVFIEATGFEISLSAWVWEMDEAQEEVQKTANLHTMRDWLAGIIQRPAPKEGAEDEDEEEEEDEGGDGEIGRAHV